MNEFTEEIPDVELVAIIEPDTMPGAKRLLFWDGLEWTLDFMAAMRFHDKIELTEEMIKLSTMDIEAMPVLITLEVSRSLDDSEDYYLMPTRVEELVYK